MGFLDLQDESKTLPFEKKLFAYKTFNDRERIRNLDKLYMLS